MFDPAIMSINQVEFQRDEGTKAEMVYVLCAGVKQEEYWVISGIVNYETKEIE